MDVFNHFNYITTTKQKENEWKAKFTYVCAIVAPLNSFNYLKTYLKGAP